MDLSDPAFPHGTNRGYQGGCRRNSPTPCPSTPSCHDAHAAMMRDYKATPNDHTGGAKTHFVMRRLDQTIEHAGLEAALERIGVTAEELADLRANLGRTMPDEVAEQLDQAWSFLVHGSDTRAPGFVHGKHISYTVGRCRCRPCTDAASGMAKRRKTGRRAPGAVIVERDLVAKIKRHVTALTKVGGVNQIARAAGMTSCPVRAVLDGGASTYRTGAKLLAVTPEKVRAAAAAGEQVPADQTVFHLRTMWALGYPLNWQADKIGATKQDVSHLVPGALVTRGRAEAIVALAREVGDKPAGPAAGVSTEIASRARAAARRAGWYPPACYDDNLNLILEAIPGNPWDALETRAAKLVHAAFLVGQGKTISTAARECGLSDTTVEKESRLWFGYTYGQTATNAKTKRRDGACGLDSGASKARIKEVAEAFHAIEDGEVNPVAAALSLGKRWGSNTGGSRLPAEALNHPELVAWREREAADRHDMEATAA